MSKELLLKLFSGEKEYNNIVRNLDSNRHMLSNSTIDDIVNSLAETKLNELYKDGITCDMFDRDYFKFQIECSIRNEILDRLVYTITDSITDNEYLDNICENILDGFLIKQYELSNDTKVDSDVYDDIDKYSDLIRLSTISFKNNFCSESTIRGKSDDKKIEIIKDIINERYGDLPKHLQESIYNLV